ncbi:hypothetical protein CDL15_Pgr013011 [Punica granatum]|uniref:Uncharacterized protein n=1 Tax=Punica granatum TaxID=22663 RepID=A0A218XFK4_PUNGR|nr:hypothetical protein CDL15_Pgr013011 [Punica granatum]
MPTNSLGLPGLWKNLEKAKEPVDLSGSDLGRTSKSRPELPDIRQDLKSVRFGLICLNKPDWSWSTRLLGPLKIWLEVAQWSWWLKVILMVKNSQDKLAKPEKAKLPSFVLS